MNHDIGKSCIVPAHDSLKLCEDTNVQYADLTPRDKITFRYSILSHSNLTYHAS